jgi:hypothetical protein
MNAPVIRVPRPRLESVRRHVAGRVSLNDCGVATASTALIELLETMTHAGCSETAGYDMRYTIPFQLGATAAEAVLAPSLGAGFGWAAYQVDAAWEAVPKANGALEATAKLQNNSPNFAHFRTETRSGGIVIVSGQIHYFRVRIGAAAPSSGQPVKRHSPSDGSYSGFLLQLLMNPVGGGAEPLGRMIHPAGSVPFGAALFQARRVKPGHQIAAASMEYHKPFIPAMGFLAQSETAEDGRVVVNLRDSTGARLARAYVRFAA